MSDLADTRFSVNGSYRLKDDNERAMLDLLPEDPEEGTVKVPLHARNRHRIAPPETRPPATEIAGLPEGWVTPDGWLLGPHGVWEIRGSGRREREVRIAVAPIWIAARWRDVDSGAISLEVAWVGGSATLRRAVALSHRDLLALADRGAPVSSQSAGGIVRWLEAAEAANAAILLMVAQIGHLGWTTTADGAAALQDGTGPHHLTLGEGLAQVHAAIQPAGTWAAWLELAQEVHRVSPLSATLLAASVGSVLLSRTGPVAAPFVVDVHGQTSTGKSVALRWACSGWGAPQDGAGVLTGWDTSPTAIERRAGRLRNYPLFLDDTKKIRPRDREGVASVIYNWSAGQGRGRGDIDGQARAVTTWRSVLISTGEQRIADVLGGQHAGAQMRMLPLALVPFPPECETVVRIESMDTWAHLPARIGARCVEVGDTALRARWAEERARLAVALGGGARGLRLAGMGATVMLAVDLLTDIGVPMPAGAVEAAVVDGLLSTRQGADLAMESWTRICGWLAAAGDRISDRPGEEGRSAPAAGWIGRAIGDHVAVLPAVVEGELRRLGYEPGEVIGQWEARGWLIPGGAGKRAQTVRRRGVVTRLWVLEVGEGLGEPEVNDGEADEDGGGSYN